MNQGIQQLEIAVNGHQTAQQYCEVLQHNVNSNLVQYQSGQTVRYLEETWRRKIGSKRGKVYAHGFDSYS